MWGYHGPTDCFYDRGLSVSFAYVWLSGRTIITCILLQPCDVWDQQLYDAKGICIIIFKIILHHSICNENNARKNNVQEIDAKSRGYIHYIKHICLSWQVPKKKRQHNPHTFCGMADGWGKQQCTPDT